MAKEKSKFSLAFKELFKRRWAGALIIIALAVIAALIGARVTPEIVEFSQFSDGVSEFVYEYNLDGDARFDIGSIFLKFCVILGGIISVYNLFAVKRSFNEIYNKRACDLYFSSPIKRTQRFNAAAVFSLAVNAVAYAAGCAVYLALSLGVIRDWNRGNDINIIRPCAVVCAAVILLALLTLLLQFMVCAVSAGTRLHYLAFCIVITIFGAAACLGLWNGVNNIWGYISFSTPPAIITPVGNAFITASAMDDTKTVIIAAVISAAELIGAYAFGIAAFNRRKAEDAEVSSSGRVFPLGVIFLASFAIMVDFSWEGGNAASIGTGVIAAAVAAAVLSLVIYKKPFNKRALVALGCACVAGVAAIGAINGVGKSYERYIPQAEDIESVDITVDGYGLFIKDGYSVFWGFANPYAPSENQVFEFTQPEGVEKALALHQKVSSEGVRASSRALEEDYTEYSDETAFELKYKLKSGKTVTRRYIVNENYVLTEIKALVQTREFISQISPFSADSRVCSVQVNTNNPYYSERDERQYYSLPNAMEATEYWQDLRECLLTDYTSVKPDELNYDLQQKIYDEIGMDIYDYSFDDESDRERGCIYIFTAAEDAPQEFFDTLEQVGFQEFYYNNEYSEYHQYIETEMHCAIYEDFTQTLNYLQSAGLA